MAYPRSFLEEIKNRVSVSDIVGRKVKLTRRGREFVGLSPFKNERTPSFTVNDEKQFYHCFSTSKHGSIFDFLMETEGLSFPEAVERLAGQAGLQVPDQDPAQAKREEEKSVLVEAHEKATSFYKTQLMGGKGRVAYEYLIKRGVDDALIRDFGIGYAPGDRHALLDYLTGQGIGADKIVEAGLAIQPDDGGQPYDRFRNRVMFPIHDARGQAIAFGGRALDADAPAKYLNSPETPLFHKGHVLFNYAKARQTAYDTKNVLVCEGYMDVVGLARGGFHNAVASLGTAVTENQISMLWRLAQEPVLCLDGDEAGLRAAYRVIDRALPLLKPGYSLRFAVLPAGKDPDDLVREGGNEAMKNVLDRANSMVGMLWDRELAVAPFDTPERRAALSDRLRTAVRQIQNADVRRFYGEEIRKRLDQLFDSSAGPGAASGRGGYQQRSGYGGGYGSGYGGRGGKRQYGNTGRQNYHNKFGGQFGGMAAASAEARRSALATGADLLPTREAMIVLAYLRHPAVFTDQQDRFERLDLTTASLDKLRHCIIDVISHHEPLDSEALKGHLIGLGHSDLITRLEQLPDARMLTFVRPESNPEDVLSGWLDAVELQHKLITLVSEKSEAETELAADTTQENFERLKAIELEISALEQKALN